MRRFRGQRSNQFTQIFQHCIIWYSKLFLFSYFRQLGNVALGKSCSWLIWLPCARQLRTRDNIQMDENNILAWFCYFLSFLINPLSKAGEHSSADHRDEPRWRNLWRKYIPNPQTDERQRLQIIQKRRDWRHLHQAKVLMHLKCQSFYGLVPIPKFFVPSFIPNKYTISKNCTCVLQTKSWLKSFRK